MSELFDRTVINNAIIDAIHAGNDTVINMIRNVAERIGFTPKMGEMGKAQNVEYIITEQLIFLIELGKIEWLADRRYRIVDDTKEKEHINGY